MVRTDCTPRTWICAPLYSERCRRTKSISPKPDQSVIRTRSQRDKAQQRLWGYGNLGLEEPVHDFVERAVTAHRDDHLEPVAQSESRKTGGVARFLREGKLERTQRRAQVARGAIPASAGRARGRRWIDHHHGAQRVAIGHRPLQAPDQQQIKHCTPACCATRSEALAHDEAVRPRLTRIPRVAAKLRHRRERADEVIIVPQIARPYAHVPSVLRDTCT